ncbi:MAG: Gfo/Idh/MocA family oxidoreductase [Mycetocola sp.]
MTAGSVTALRWGIAGTGKVSDEIADDFALVQDAQLVGVSSRTDAAAYRFADAHGIGARYSDYDAMLTDVDAVYIGTPHATHFDYAKRALSRGRHVLCEKPLTLRPADAVILADLARHHGVFLMEAMWMKFNPLHQRLISLVNEGAIGDLRSVHATFGYPFPKDGSSRWQASMAGSALLDQGIYPVTLAHMLLGEPESISAAGTVTADGIDLSSHFTFEYSGGRFAQGASSMVDFLDMTASITGTEGFISIGSGFWFASALELHQETADGFTRRRIEVEREGHGYTPMLRAVTAAIQAGATEHPLHTPAHAADTLALLAEIRRQIPVIQPAQPKRTTSP